MARVIGSVTTVNTQELAHLYQHHIRRLSVEDRLRLLAIMAEELAESGPAEAAPQLSILGLRGLGAEIWEGIDAQEYVNQLRAEWEGRP